MTCFECGKPAEHEHHVVPVVLGGKKKIPLCADCHSKVHAPESSISRGLLIHLGHKEGRRYPKINFEKYHALLKMKESGLCGSECARRLGVSRETISNLLRGEGTLPVLYAKVKALFDNR